MATPALRLTCYLTPQQIPAVEPANREQGSGTLYLVPEEYAGRTLPLPVAAFVLPTGHNPIGCKYKPAVSVGHVWSPDPTLEGSAAPFHATACLVRVQLPRTPFWSGAEIEPQLTGNSAAIGPAPATGLAGGSTDESLLIPEQGWEITLHPVPGEELLVTHHTHGHGSWNISGYHSCTGLTGGWITAKYDHPTVEGAYAYDVSVEGQTHTALLPTDFEPRSVGDWCFLLRRSGADDLTFPATTPKSPDEDSYLMLAPLTILGEG